MDLSSLDPDDPLATIQLGFSLVEGELGVPPVMTAQEMAQCACPDRLAMLSYLSQVYDALHGEIPYVKPKIAVSTGRNPLRQAQDRGTRRNPLRTAQDRGEYGEKSPTASPRSR